MMGVLATHTLASGMLAKDTSPIFMAHQAHPIIMNSKQMSRQLWVSNFSLTTPAHYNLVEFTLQSCFGQTRLNTMLEEPIQNRQPTKFSISFSFILTQHWRGPPQQDKELLHQAVTLVTSIKFACVKVVVDMFFHWPNLRLKAPKSLDRSIRAIQNLLLNLIWFQWEVTYLSISNYPAEAMPKLMFCKLLPTW